MSIPFAEADGKNKPLLRRALLRSANQHDSLIFLLYPDNNNDLLFPEGGLSSVHLFFLPGLVHNNLSTIRLPI